jgi:2-keto-4-pentenoate hydratase/2-oxohepta-3-ene-1,7-dioic acid hydratase in catechol pathway
LKLVTYMIKADQLNIQMNRIEGARLGWVSGLYIVDVVFAQRWMQLAKGVSFLHDLPSDMQTLLEGGPVEIKLLQEVERAIRGEPLASLQVEGEPVAIQWKEAQLLAPLPVPKRFYTPRQCDGGGISGPSHAMYVVPERDQSATFSLSHPRPIIGLDAPVSKPKYTKELDFGLAIACVIGKRGRNIPSDQAIGHIAGFMILNNWHACEIERQEMAGRLGAATKNDFVSSMGPYLVTVDELEDRRQGEHWDLAMSAKVNERLVLQGNVKDLYGDFMQMIERISAKYELVSGDVIDSGTTSTKYTSASAERRSLQPGDTVELEIECLGVLRNKIVSAIL